MTSLRDIRQQFLSFFEGQGHTVAASSALVPDNDPTLLFTNAGMVQFKDYFTGGQTPPYPRAVTSQKCVRAGGKHNDLDNVGYTARHHTFFEMLGNFSFGDYFKAQAIEHAWNLVTKDFGLDKDKLLVTVYHTDNEAFDLWKKIAGLSDDRIIRIATSDNFWAMGDTGPCGPCSEIFYDHGADVPGGPPGSPDEDGDRFIEIWNLVFMQFERSKDGKQTPLPKPSIDTGMGLERTAAILQGKHDNYDIDLFQNLIGASVELTGVKAEGDAKFSHRVIADHLRSCSFLMADGVSPSNEGRGYVLRRIMRRAMPTANMGEGDTLDGETAFKLYDTYGFPLDLTQDALRAKGIEVDTEGFDAAMTRQKEDSRAVGFKSGDVASEKLWQEIKNEFGETDFTGLGKSGEDLGRDYTSESNSKLLAIIKNGLRVDSANKGEKVSLVFDKTPFYAESGGQAGDIGTIRLSNADAGDVTIKISDVQKKLKCIHILMGEVQNGEIQVGDSFEQYVNTENRKKTKANHSATHIMHEALRRVLGEHVTQKGQMVDGERIRFDISHGAAITREELARVEDQVNQVILQNSVASTELMNPEAAKEAGAMALFGETYGDEVRVLSLGEPIDEEAKKYSVELCGGTHVERTGDIALFKIVSEGAVAAGIRRVEAVTGEAARQYLETQASYTRAAADKLKAKPEDVPTRIEALMAERKKLEKELSEAKKALALGGSGGAAKAEEINGVKFIGGVLDGVSGKDLRAMLNDQLSAIGSGIVGFVAKDGQKVAVAVAVTDDLVGTYNAATLVNAGAEKVGGRGGGKPGMAQAGGNNVAGADDALAAIKAAIG